MFEIKLNALLYSDKSVSQSTGYISIDDIKKVFCTTPAWNELWSNMEALLKTSTFKEFVIHDHFLKSVPDKDEHINYTTQLEFGILGLLWCSDT